MSLLDTINQDVSSTMNAIQTLAASTGQTFDPNPMHSTFLQSIFGGTPAAPSGSGSGAVQPPAGTVNIQKILLYGAGAYFLMKILK